jgi:hypothetical protein
MFMVALNGGSPLLAPMLYNISCANKAETVLQTGDSVSARRLLLQAFEKLLAIAGCPASPIALRINCIRHLGYSLAILNQDFGEQMERPDIKLLLTRAATIVREVECIACWMMSQNGSPTGHKSSNMMSQLYALQ